MTKLFINVLNVINGTSSPDEYNGSFTNFTQKQLNEAERLLNVQMGDVIEFINFPLSDRKIKEISGKNILDMSDTDISKVVDSFIEDLTTLIEEHDPDCIPYEKYNLDNIVIHDNIYLNNNKRALWFTFINKLKETGFRVIYSICTSSNEINYESFYRFGEY